MKQFQYIIEHLEHMVDDQYDYYLYSMRKFTLHAFEGLMSFNDNDLYKYGPVCKAAGDLVRLLVRVQKDQAAQLASFTPIFDEY